MRISTLLLAAAVAAAFASCPPAIAAAQDNGGHPVYRSPFDAAFSPDGRALAVSDHTAGRLVLIDASTHKVVGQTEVRGEPAGVVWSADGRRVYVAECAAGSVAEIDRSGRLRRRLEVGPRPIGLALAPRRGWLLAANSATDTVSVVELATGREKGRVRVRHMPYFLAVTPDENTAVVGNRLPRGAATDPAVSAAVTLVDLGSLAKAADIVLPRNSTNVLAVAISPDGRWAYVVHNLGRTALPTEQIEHGWINANAMTIIDLAARRRYATVLLDRADLGAANPWGAAVGKRGATLWITLSGVHQLGRLDVAGLHRLLGERLPEIADKATDKPNHDARDTATAAAGYFDPSPEKEKDTESVEILTSDAPVQYGRGLFLPGLFARVDLPGNGPRGLALSPDGRRLAVAEYFTGSVLWVDVPTARIIDAVPVGKQAEADAARRGEMIFHDATHSFQHWLSCATCHPDGRADGLNWDLLNDGIGNPKNTRSMLLAGRTPPATWRGVRPNMEAAADAGFKFIFFQDAGADQRRAVYAYIRSLRPAKSPYSLGGRLSEKAARGKALFESPQTRCAACHRGPLRTDLKTHDVGTRGKLDWAGRFDTPALVELWRTGPYLHDGRAETLREVVTEFNQDDRHGGTSHLSAEEIDALVAYLRCL